MSGRHFSGHARSGAFVVLASLMLLPAQASGKTFVTRGVPDDSPVYKPHSFVAGSGAGGGVLGFSGVRWSQWGNNNAVGRGRYKYNICKPMCASGNYRTARARIRLYRPRLGCEIYQDGETVRANVRLFTRIEIKYNGRTFRSLTSGTQSCQ